jgi:cold shock CspA family protein
VSTGVVKKWFLGCGYGFIGPDDEDGVELFVHFRQLIGTDQLREGQRVKYERRPDPRALGKFEASRVCVI